MPIVCGICGSENRSNAKFCIGCAGRLPGFAPSGTVALKPERVPVASQPQPAFSQPQPAFSARAPESDPSPSGSTSTSFWLHLGLVGLTMIIGFVAWIVYVLHHGTAPWTEFSRMMASTPELRQSEPAVKAKASESSLQVPPTALAPAAAHALAPAPAPAPVPAPTPASTTPAATTAFAPTAPTLAPATSPATALAFAPATKAPSATYPPTRNARPEKRSIERARRTLRDEEADYEPAYQMPTPQPRVLPDPGPPIAPGPGPQYSWTRPSSPRTYDDPGPPVVAGPGPRYETRPEVRAPSSSTGNDPGPPIAIGPGPRYDYSTPAARK
jgi:hypothetical protein